MSLNGKTTFFTLSLVVFSGGCSGPDASTKKDKAPADKTSARPKKPISLGFENWHVASAFNMVDVAKTRDKTVHGYRWSGGHVKGVMKFKEGESRFDCSEAKTDKPCSGMIIILEDEATKELEIIVRASHLVNDEDQGREVRYRRPYEKKFRGTYSGESLSTGVTGGTIVYEDGSVERTGDSISLNAGSSRVVEFTFTRHKR